MGSGKTTALIRWLREAIHSPDTSVLVVSCRRSFTQTLATRFAESGLVDFVTYFSSTNYIMNDRPFHRLIVQVESLHRVGPNLLNNYDVLVLDEVMSTLGQLYSPTMQQLGRVDALMLRLLRTCPRIIAMDATANAQLVDFLCGLRGEKKRACGGRRVRHARVFGAPVPVSPASGDRAPAGCPAPARAAERPVSGRLSGRPGGHVLWGAGSAPWRGR